MKTKELILVACCLYLCNVRCPAQEEGGGIINGIDISYDLDSRLERWINNNLLLILICPHIISPNDDPFALSGEKNKLSVLGYGRLEKEDANRLVSSLDKKLLRVPRLTGGFHAELYFLCASSPFSPLDKLSCYISNGFVDVKFDDGKGRVVWVGLPDKCSKLIVDNFVRKSINEDTSSEQD